MDERLEKEEAEEDKERSIRRPEYIISCLNVEGGREWAGHE